MITDTLLQIEDLKYLMYNLLHMEVQGISKDDSFCTDRRAMTRVFDEDEIKKDGLMDEMMSSFEE